jgi:hypothetical protein
MLAAAATEGRAVVEPGSSSNCSVNASIGTTLDRYDHVMPGIQEEAAEKVDAGLRAALAGLRRRPRERR